MKRKKTDIPEHVEIAAHKVPVKFRDGLVDHAAAFGLFDKNELTIYIDKSLENNSSLAWETFWHEVLEVLNFVTESNMKHRDIQTMGLLLHQVFHSAFFDKITDSE